MNLAQNQSLKIFLTSFIILLIGIITLYIYSYDKITKNHLKLADDMASELSATIENNLLEKIKTVKAIAITPIILDALEESNQHFSGLSKQQRDKEIQSKNAKWKTIKDNNHQFILKYTDNIVAKYLGNQQDNLKGEYGEIFITDKYGALIASTAKLTTFAHGNKYWWKGSYDNGEGTVFLDDRGYDDSVEGYVLGVVVPIKNGNEIIGILKANLNILGSIDRMISNVTKDNSEQLFIMRSGGLIIYQEGLEPLSKRVSTKLLGKVLINENSFIFKEEAPEGIYSRSEIGITARKQGYYFGGSFESIDHKKGNTGELWYIVVFYPISNIIEPANNNLKILLLIGILLSCVLAITSMIIGNMAAKPIKKLIKQTLLISKGDYNSKVFTKRSDEIGQLATSFNQMTKNLKETTTSIENLNVEISERKQVEMELKESEEKYRLIDNASVDFIYSYNIDGKYTHVNPSLIKHFGLPLEQILGKTHRDLNFPEEICQEWDELHRKVYEINNTVLSETSSPDGSGELRYYEVILNPLHNAEGNIIGIAGMTRDITQRKQVELELKRLFAKTKKLETIINRSPAIAFLWRAEENWPVDYVSENIKQFGYTPEDFLSAKVLFSKIIHPDDCERVFREVADYSQSEISEFTQEYRIITKLGDIKWINDHTWIRRNSNNRVTHYQGIIGDITERKQKDEQIRKLSVAIEQSPATVVITDLNGDIEYVNPKFSETTGYSAEEAMSKNPRILKSDETSSEEYKELWKTITSGKEWRGEFHNKKKNGELYWELASISPIRNKNGMTTHYLGIKEEITERKQAEETILNSEKRYKYLFEQSPISIWEEDFSELKKYLDSLKKKGIENFKDYFEKNPDEVEKCTRMVRILDINEMTVKLFNAKNKTELLTNLNNIYIEDSRTTFIEQFCLVANNQTNFSLETINKTMDGKILDVLLNWAVVPGHKKDFSKVLITIIDITEKNKSEAELKINSKRLRMLNKIIRHDLSNDFNVINSAVKIFKRSSDVTLLDEIERRVQKSLNAISGYREYESHLNSSTGLDELDLSNVINNVAVEYPGIKCKIEGTGRVYGDDTLYSVFENLFSNSIKHGKASQISIKISADDDMCRLKFADNGTGIPEEIKDKVFYEGFHHGESGNTGIGLYIVKQTIERYGGFISVEDNKPNGAVFVLSLRRVMG